MILKGRERLKQACKGFFFFMAQISFCKRYLVESDTEYRRAEVLFSFFLFFFLNHALGKLQKLNRKYEIWKFKKGTNLSKMAKK